MGTFHSTETARTTIRRLTTADEADFVALLSDRRVTATLAFDEETMTERGTKHLLGLITSLYDSDNPILIFGVEGKQSGALVGATGYNSLDEEEAELFYAISPAFWGQGFASEVVAEMVRYAFENLPFTTLKAFVTPDNEGAKRVAEKNGFENAGQFKNPNFFEPVYLYQREK
ncbi:GNAT family N-acetyltransferase [Tunicatimonas pelagia]|uniref:GNAT family N-acetyltransferase n=1 Tax=Tunicatimonas pelagia TaxID=931531 RepID=UPI002665065A|nr:GNAT family N-acetyltransferase [Tunicatimonas pelagia]WKN44101.1 GNAT family N-acetyltransferase [Tunicatimonas pelagia]